MEGGTGSERTTVAGRPPPSGARSTQPQPDGPDLWAGVAHRFRQYVIHIASNGRSVAPLRDSAAVDRHSSQQGMDGYREGCR